jgi:hypothetical protein
VVTELVRLAAQRNLVVLHPKRDDPLARITLEHFAFYGELDGALVGMPGKVLIGAPLAILKVPTSHDAFLDLVGPKTRNMIRKAHLAGYTFAPFNWNDRLSEIHAINTSKARRDGAPMRGGYAKPVEPRFHTPTEEEKLRLLGGFRADGTLCAYAFVILNGDVAFMAHCIGHAQDLAHGVMNALTAEVVRALATVVDYIEYGVLNESNANVGVSRFKRHNGFTSHAVILALELDSE